MYVADHGADDDRADSEQPGQRSACCPGRHVQLLPGVAQLVIDAAQVIEDAAVSSRAASTTARGGASGRTPESRLAQRCVSLSTGWR